LRVLANKTVRNRAYRLLLITNRKSYTGFRLPPRAMALNDLNIKIRVLWIFGDFGLRHTFQKRIAPKSLEIDRDSLHMKLSALNVVFTFKFCLPRSRIFRTWESNLNTFFKILAFGHSNGSIHARRWRHLAYVNTSYPMSVAGIDELRFVRSGPSNMHRCRAFPFALARLSCKQSKKSSAETHRSSTTDIRCLKPD